MSYHKEVIVDGGCPTSSGRVKAISMHLDDFENEPVYAKTINCNSCQGFYNCVFNHEPCIVYKCIKRKFNWVPARDAGGQLRFCVPERFADAIIRTIEYGIARTQKTK